MRRASSSRNYAAALAAFFFVSGQPAAARGPQDPQMLPVDPMPLVITTQNGPKSYSVEIADEPAERAVGMMFRRTAPRDRAMLFDFGQTRMVTMWMRGTFAPLDILFIGEDLRIVRISPDAVPLSEEFIGSGQPVRFALELAAGEAKRAGIAAGDLVRHPAMVRAAGGDQGQ